MAVAYEKLKSEKRKVSQLSIKLWLLKPIHSNASTVQIKGLDGSIGVTKQSIAFSLTHTAIVGLVHGKLFLCCLSWKMGISFNRETPRYHPKNLLFSCLLTMTCLMYTLLLMKYGCGYGICQTACYPS